MGPEKLVYAAIGAPVTIARTAIDTATACYHDLVEKSGSQQELDSRIAEWATEGEKVLESITDVDLVDELVHRLDLDNARTQLEKLRDQLEQRLGTLGSSFAPEEGGDTEATPNAS